MPRTWRERIEANIYRDQYGISAKVQVGPWTREQRWEPDTPITTPRKWVTANRAQLQKLRPTSKRGTLKADVEGRYEEAKKHLRSWISRRSELRAWVALYGHLRRARIARTHVIAARNTWLEAGVAPKTINNRVDSLAQLYRELDGTRAPTPCDELEPLEVPATVPQVVEPATILKVYEALVAQEKAGKLRTKHTRARFMVLAASGVRPVELQRAQPSDVDLVRRIWRTRNAKGGYRPGGLYLGTDLLVALTFFAQVGAWGPFRTGSFDRVLRNNGWPEGVRPYMLRHTVGMELSEAGGHDLADISAWLGHTRTSTTRSHYVPVSSGRMRELGETIGHRIGWPAATLEV
jgi:integrase